MIAGFCSRLIYLIFFSFSMCEVEEDSTGAIDAGISSVLSANESRFASLGEEELQLLLDGRLSKCTKQTISYALNIYFVMTGTILRCVS